jgi:predicted HTH domain antitoxin
MTEAIGVRLDDDMRTKIDTLSREEVLDRSSTIRKLLRVGYSEFMKKKVLAKYRKGSITLTEAAEITDMTVWEIQQYFVQEGYMSSYTVEDLNHELKLLGTVK